MKIRRHHYHYHILLITPYLYATTIAIVLGGLFRIAVNHDQFGMLITGFALLLLSACADRECRRPITSEDFD